ncbi:hypothetical protein [Candidatus Carsonella ruddii]|uniref:Ribosomal protein L18 n=1 Tax=Carsonella ruddii TaxID=114186 RepID=A0A1U9RSZ2_CARRU|nr:hypothetical protein [Candidatus Carsonella ruddii]AQU89575.1 hypothetical protein BW244_0157 [Candidatus Carsonella ruddii]
MKIILKKTNKNFLVYFLNNNKNIYFIKNKKKNFIFLFEKVLKIILFFNKKIFYNKKNYNGYYKKIINFINKKNGR